jgi:hypothetical protein
MGVYHTISSFVKGGKRVSGEIRRDSGRLGLVGGSSGVYSLQFCLRKTENRGCEPVGDSHRRLGGRLGVVALDGQRWGRSVLDAAHRRCCRRVAPCPVRCGVPRPLGGGGARLPVDEWVHGAPAHADARACADNALPGSRQRAGQAVRAARRGDGNRPAAPPAGASDANRAAMGRVPCGERRRCRSERGEPRARPIRADARAHSVFVGSLDERACRHPLPCPIASAESHHLVRCRAIR